jgi:hypothetical protein
MIRHPSSNNDHKNFLSSFMNTNPGANPIKLFTVRVKHLLG